MPDEDKNTSCEDELEVLEKHILVNILEIPVAIVSNIFQTANCQNEEQALALLDPEAS